jgi:hypothetical protein
MRVCSSRNAIGLVLPANVRRRGVLQQACHGVPNQTRVQFDRALARCVEASLLSDHLENELHNEARADSEMTSREGRDDNARVADHPPAAASQ